MRLAVLALALCASACVSAPPAPPPPRLVALPSGTQGVEVRCGGIQRSFADCMNAAARICGGPYQIVSQDAHSNGAIAFPVGNWAGQVQVQRRSLIVSCGA